MMEQQEEVMEASTSEEKETSKVKISFGVKRTKTVQLKQTVSAVVDVQIDSDEERELEEEESRNKRRRLTHFEDGSALDEDDKKKKTIVIPMVKEVDWRVAKLLALEKEGKLTDEDRAKLAILTEEQPFASTNGSANDNGAIVVEDEVKTTEDADYSAVPIEEFGLTILRGCSWKDGEGIGRHPQVAPLRLPPRRPNGLGLGAKPQPEKTAKNANGQDQVEEEIKKDFLIRVTTGRFKGQCGKVESRDDDNNSLFTRLAGGQHVKISLFAVQQVTKKEYDKDSKCINKDDYDRERDKIERRNHDVTRDTDSRKYKDDRRDREERSMDRYREKGEKHRDHKLSPVYTNDWCGSFWSSWGGHSQADQDWGIQLQNGLNNYCNGVSGFKNMTYVKSFENFPFQGSHNGYVIRQERFDSCNGIQKIARSFGSHIESLFNDEGNGKRIPACQWMSRNSKFACKRRPEGNWVYQYLALYCAFYK